jgi:hypothetical protein
MASVLSNCVEDPVASLQEAVRKGDWARAGQLAATLSQTPVPMDATLLGKYLDNLRETVVLAKVSRSHMVATLNRLRAAAKFNAAGTSLPGTRHDFADLTGS